MKDPGFWKPGFQRTVNTVRRLSKAGGGVPVPRRAIEQYMIHFMGNVNSQMKASGCAHMQGCCTA